MSLTFLKGQVGFMRSRGIEVQALCSPGPEIEAFERDEGVPVHQVEMPRRITPLADLKAVRDIVRTIRRERPTIVHAHTPKGGLLGMIAAAIARIPVRIYHMRGLPMLGARGPKRMLLRMTERISCRLAHRVICVSHSIRNAAIEAGLVPPDKISVMAGGSGQGVDVQRFDPSTSAVDARIDTRKHYGIPQDAVVIGFVGRLVRDKGIVELHDVWRTLRARHPHVHLLLVGPFEPRDPVPDHVRHLLESDSRVHLAGMNWDTPPLYAAMDIVTLPSYREGFPNVPLEAAAMELPVVSTRVPGCIDAVADGETGKLVPPRDASALTHALEAYIKDPDLRRRHGHAGRERVERDFRREVVWEAIYQTYCDLLREHGIAIPARVPEEAAL